MSRPHGYLGLSNGQVAGTITLPAFQPNNAFEFDYLYVENETDPNPLFIGVVIGPKTTSSFAFTLSTAPDTANYVLRWGLV